MFHDNVNHETSFEDDYLSCPYHIMIGIGERIRQAREAAGLSQAALAKRVGCGQSTIAQYETETNEPNHIRLVSIATQTGVNLEWILTGKGEMPARRNTTLGQHKKHISTGNIGSPVSVKEHGKEPLPVRGFLKQGEHGYYFDNGQTRDSVGRPAELIGVESAYAMQLRDYSMPPLQPGWWATFDPTKPVRAGDLVAVYLLDGQAMFKELVRIGSAEVTVRQYQPAKDITFKLSEIEAIHRFATIHAERP